MDNLGGMARECSGKGMRIIDFSIRYALVPKGISREWNHIKAIFEAMAAFY